MYLPWYYFRSLNEVHQLRFVVKVGGFKMLLGNKMRDKM